MNTSEQLKQFFSSSQYGVVGASNRRHKFGNKVLRCYLQNKMIATPVHPTEKQIEGIDCFSAVSDLPEEVSSISIITPPQVTEMIVEQAVAKGITNIWMQPGAESAEAVRFCLAKEINLIYGGTCLLVVLGFFDH